jgi:hypothetical protein
MNDQCFGNLGFGQKAVQGDEEAACITMFIEPEGIKHRTRAVENEIMGVTLEQELYSGGANVDRECQTSQRARAAIPE